MPPVGALARPAALTGFQVHTSLLWQTNAVTVRVDGTIVLVDSPVLPGELSALPRPDVLVTTHAHFDHVLGRAAFPDLPLHAGPSTVAHLREHAEDTLAELRDSDAELYVEREREPRLDDVQPLPGDLFQTVEADGHAPDGAALFAEQHALLVPGDYLCGVEIPLVSRAGSPERYLATLERVTPLVRRAEHIVPGHGPALRRARALQLLDADRRYVEALAAGVATDPPLRGPPSHRQLRIHEDNVAKHPRDSPD